MSTLPIEDILQANTELYGLLGNPVRVHEDIAPRGTPFPYAVWLIVGGDPQNHLDCPANVDHVTFQIFVYDNIKARASDMREMIRQTLEMHCTVTDSHLRSFERIADTNIFGRGIQANWFLDR